MIGTQPARQTYPDEHWLCYKSPEEAGWSSDSFGQEGKVDHLKIEMRDTGFYLLPKVENE